MGSTQPYLAAFLMGQGLFFQRLICKDAASRRVLPLPAPSSSKPHGRLLFPGGGRGFWAGRETGNKVAFVPFVSDSCFPWGAIRISHSGSQPKTCFSLIASRHFPSTQGIPGPRGVCHHPVGSRAKAQCCCLSARESFSQTSEDITCSFFSSCIH